MSVGERGPAGDHGQTGSIGSTGLTGKQGEPGKPGVAPWVVRKATTAYLILALGVCIAIGISFHNQRVSDKHICQTVNDNREVLTDLINRTGQTLTTPPDASPELRDILEQSRKSGDDFRKYAVSRLKPLDC